MQGDDGSNALKTDPAIILDESIELHIDQISGGLLVHHIHILKKASPFGKGDHANRDLVRPNDDDRTEIDLCDPVLDILRDLDIKFFQTLIDTLDILRFTEDLQVII